MAFGNCLLIVAFVLCVMCTGVKCDEGDIDPKAVEEGRTFAHNAMKRLSILLPAFMFKLGIMFTMLLVSMITSTKSLLVGTLLLALGVGHFIATKFSAVSSPVTAHLSLPHYAHYPHAHLHTAVPHILERSDSVPTGSQGNVGTYPAPYASQYAQGQAYSAWRQ